MAYGTTTLVDAQRKLILEIAGRCGPVVNALPTPPKEASAESSSGSGASSCIGFGSSAVVMVAVLVCVRDDLMAARSCQGNRGPSFSGLPRDCAADHTAAAVGKRDAADHCMFVCFGAPTRG